MRHLACQLDVCYIGNGPRASPARTRERLVLDGVLRVRRGRCTLHILVLRLLVPFISETCSIGCDAPAVLWNNALGVFRIALDIRVHWHSSVPVAVLPTQVRKSDLYSSGTPHLRPEDCAPNAAFLSGDVEAPGKSATGPLQSLSGEAAFKGTLVQ